LNAVSEASPAASIDPALQNRPAEKNPDLTEAEVAALTSAEASRPIPSPAVPTSTDGSSGPDEHQLTEAEDQLAAELAQLMAEVPAAAPAASVAPRAAGATDAPTPPSSESDAEMQATVDALTAVLESAQSPSAAPVAPVATPTEMPKVASDAATDASADAASAQPEKAAAATLPVESPASGFESASAAPRSPGRVVQFFRAVFLMLAQLMDMPFSWLSEYDKNVIGFAALILLLSGILLHVLAWIYH
jgi:hypothetical protein